MNSEYMNMNSAFIKLETVKEENPEQKFRRYHTIMPRRKEKKRHN